MLAKVKDAGKSRGNRFADNETIDHGLDLQNPRTIAALKVTGIQLSDLELDPQPAEGSSDIEIRRHEVKSLKVNRLLGELRETAESLDTRDVDALISGPGRVDERAVFQEEKARIDKQRERAKAELQRRAAWEVETQQAVIRQSKDLDIMSRRIAEQKEEKARKESAWREAKRTKVETNIKAARDRQMEDRKRMMDKIKETDERVDNNLENILKERGARKGWVQEKADEAARRLQEHEYTLFQTAMRKHLNNTKRTAELEGWIDRRDKDQMRSQMEAKGHSDCRRQAVLDGQATDAQEREKAATRTLRKLEKAREHAATNWSLLAETAKEKRTQQLERWTQNRQAQTAERRKRDQDMRAAMNKSGERTAQVVAEYRQATIGRYTGIRQIFDELVAENKERLDRSDETTREHRLDKISYQKACGESRDDQKKQANSYRVECFRERVAGQTQVEELHYLLNLSMRSSSPSRSGARSAASAAIGNRVNNILTDLGVPIPESTGVAEGEEAESGQPSANAGRGHGEAQGK